MMSCSFIFPFGKVYERGTKKSTILGAFRDHFVRYTQTATKLVSLSTWWNVSHVKRVAHGVHHRFYKGIFLI